MSSYDTGGTPAPKHHRRRRGKAGQQPVATGGHPQRKPRVAKPPKPRAPKPSQNAPSPTTPPMPQYGPLRQQAEADANLRYGQPIMQAQAGIHNAGTFFDGYLSTVAQQQGAAKARYDAAIGAVPGLAPTQSPAVQNAEGAQAAASRGIVNQSFGNMLTAQGAATQDYFGGRAVAGAAGKLQAQTQATSEVNRLSGERQQYVVARKGELKQQQHTNRLENKAFGLDVAKARADVQTDRQQTRLDRKKARQDAKPTPSEKKTTADLRFFRKHGYYPSTGKPKPATTPEKKSAFTPTQKSSARQEFRKIFKTIKSNDSGVHGYGKDIRKAIGEAGKDPLLVRAAWQLYRHGHLNPGTARALYRDYGIRAKTRKSGTTRPTPYSPPQNFPGSDAAQG